KMKKKFFLAAAILISSKGYSQSTVQQDSSKDLQEVIITANKIEQKQNETGKVITVVTQQELQRSLGQTLGEVLNRQVGMHIGGANGTLGSVQTIYTRGSASANTLILLDGVPLYDASGISSEFDLNTFALDQVERIEILKGAQSTLYGSDAVAGVINIISRKPQNNKTRFHANASAGSYKTIKGGMNISGSSRKLNYLAGYSKVYSEGFSSAYDSSGNKNFEDDGFKQDAYTARIGFAFTNKFTVDLYGKYNLNKGEIDAGAFTDDRDYRYETRNTIAGANLTYALKNASFFLKYNFNDYERRYNNDSGHIGGFSTDPFAFYTKYIREKYNGRSHFMELYGNINLHKHLNIVTGTDFRSNATSQKYLYISNFGVYEPVPLGSDTSHTNQFSAFSSLLFNNEKNISAGIGGRYYIHSVYGSGGNFSFNPTYHFNKFNVFVNVSSAYRVPSLYQLYSEFGNRLLKPERSVGYEAGFTFRDKNVSGRVVGFQRNIKDVIIFYTDLSTFSSVYKNEDKQKDHGVELEGRFSAGALTLVSNYTYVTGKINTSTTSGKDTSFSNLYRRPKNSFNLSVLYSGIKNLEINAHLRSISGFEEPIFGAAPVKLKGYYTLDMHVSYALFKSFRLFADLKNLTDQHYFDQQGFTTRGFNVLAGISLNF
ncbi:MAG: TonB-dependent receptor, partial [Ferruginibacter sp.]